MPCRGRVCAIPTAANPRYSARRRARRRYACEPLEERVLLAADLIGAAFSVNPTYQPVNPTVTANYSIKNQGATSTLGGFLVGFYLSSDATITTADTFLGSASVPKAITAGTTFSSSISLALPATDPFRTDNSYFVGMIIDTGNAILESNETNNANAEDLLARFGLDPAKKGLRAAPSMSIKITLGSITLATRPPRPTPTGFIRLPASSPAPTTSAKIRPPAGCRRGRRTEISS